MGRRPRDLSEQKFGLLTAMYSTERRDHRGSVYWHCVCECGNEIDVSAGALMDGKSISFQKEEGAFVGLDVTIKFKYVIVVIICAVAIMGGTSYYSSVYPEQKVTDVQDTVTQNEMQSPVDDEGFVFAKSSSEMLSEEMVLALSDDRTVGFQRLLRMSINEIYARHGQLFNDGEVNDIHYQKYNWYRETNKHVVEWDEFNDIEKANLRFLISIEEEYGYR
ncbi:MAG: YARHG domain-containing protein [Mediterraneibacter faecis]